jgi:diguanylate cyclase
MGLAQKNRLGPPHRRMCRFCRRIANIDHLQTESTHRQGQKTLRFRRKTADFEFDFDASYSKFLWEPKNPPGADGSFTRRSIGGKKDAFGDCVIFHFISNRLIPEKGCPVDSTSLIALAVVMALVELLAGVGIGWWLRGSGEPAPPQSAQDVERARSSLARLHELASRVAADVGEHSTRVQEISNELSNHSSENGDLENVVIGSVSEIIKANSRLQEQLKSAEDKLQEQAHQIEVHAADALTDALTGAANRRAFDSDVTRRLAEFQRRGTPFCLLMLDVDHFKKFNDTHGHLAGDEVLRGVARVLRETCRGMDSVARFGGEEFAVIMPSTNYREATANVLRICSQIAESEFEFEGKALNVTVSGGLAEISAQDDEANLVKRADEGLYAAKKNGRNCAFVHDGEKTSLLVAKSLEASPAPANSASAAAGKSAAETSADGSVDPFRTDVQTGLPNRTAFCEEVRRRAAESNRYDSKLSLMLVKVNTLQKFADRPTDPTAELVLRTVSQFLTAGMREMDMVARYQSDAFAVLLPGTPMSQSLVVAERLRAAVARCPLRGKDFELQISVSTGLAEVVRNDDSASLMKRAEAAVQASVASGKDGTYFDAGKGIELYLPKQSGSATAVTG